MNRITQLSEFLKESPNDAFLTHAMALEFVKIQDDEQAKNWFYRNKLQNPSYVATYYHLGKLLERMGNEAEAITTYQTGMIEAQKADDNHAYSELRSVCEELLY